MKIVATYLLVVLGGNPNPSADDIRSILESGDQMYRFVLLLHYTAPSAILLGDISSLRNYGVKEASAYSCSGSIRVLCAPDVHSSGAKVGQGEKPLQQGMELYPRIGKNFDIKVFTNCRFGMMSWAVLTVTYCIKQFAYAGSNILGKLALGQGLSALVFVVYRHLIAMLILAPLAYVLERNRRPSFSFGVMLKIFILAMLGITIQQNVYYVGLHLISPTVASALGNVIPAFTFLLAIVLRMEKLNLKTVRGRAKLAGAIFCITVLRKAMPGLKALLLCYSAILHVVYHLFFSGGWGLVAAVVQPLVDRGAPPSAFARRPAPRPIRATIIGCRSRRFLIVPIALDA
ncbi:hypothetical protein ZIOFF_035914 [Zingiber officinale]|uniref:WAT1-related protein n=1 Tax=Zingiber officinale TaxID=94328 RepID=A0A8J5G9S9_ZINOF|nr:hypothetical protein ZIOFF_035914 [Zingiber officinale]